MGLISKADFRRNRFILVITQKVQRIKLKLDWTYFIISISKIADVLIYRVDYRYFTCVFQEFIRKFNLDWLRVYVTQLITNNTSLVVHRDFHEKKRLFFIDFLGMSNNRGRRDIDNWSWISVVFSVFTNQIHPQNGA